MSKLTDEELSQIVEAVDQYSSFNQPVKVKLDEGATMPSQSHDTDFAFDLYLSEDVLIPPSLLSATVAKTGIHTEFDENRWGMFISPRSSIFRLPLVLTNSTGIIEGSYRGAIGIPLRNTMSHISYTKEDQTSNPKPHDIDQSIATVDYAVTINDNKKYVDKPVKDIDRDLYINTMAKFVSEAEITGLSLYELADFRSGNLPVGTIFLPSGFRITQCYLVKKVYADFQKVDELSESERGTGGFGSTGTK